MKNKIIVAGNLKGTHLWDSLIIPKGAKGVFGICYSILTWSGVAKGLSLTSPGSWIKSVGKMFEDGHATTFLISPDLDDLDLTTTAVHVKPKAVLVKPKAVPVKPELALKKSTAYLTLTGIGDEGWIFDREPLADIDWARSTGSSTTYVYYIGVDEAMLKKYEIVRNLLEGTKTDYAALWPNLPFTKTTYQNCVSHSNYLMWKLGLAFFPVQSKGWWIPSHSNWLEWFKSFVPTYHGSFWWKYKKFENTNTHIP
ncbi:hypothetical protein [Maridesulfovibrio zosterae]|uniref:hypothetical protein n=1 Tax=Maridesulfovibrio zosterae TaxID=82171 RepID=UPI000400A2E4|nr:hypothetical protein [Maridesulfovibrio zosterae]